MTKQVFTKQVFFEIARPTGEKISFRWNITAEETTTPQIVSRGIVVSTRPNGVAIFTRQHYWSVVDFLAEVIGEGKLLPIAKERLAIGDTAFQELFYFDALVWGVDDPKRVIIEGTNNACIERHEETGVLCIKFPTQIAKEWSEGETEFFEDYDGEIYTVQILNR